jgi:anaerobic selenocysteine-containing dehydrogenase
MNQNTIDTSAVGRRDFFKVAGAGVTAAAALLTPQERAVAQGLEEKARFQRIAGCTWPIRQLFKTRAGSGRGNAPLSLRAGAVAAPSPGAPSTPANRDRTTAVEMKQKYGEITMLDFPQWMKEHFPGVTRMDLF